MSSCQAPRSQSLPGGLNGPSPSLLFNNLTADESTLGYVHLNQAMMLPITGALSGDTVAGRLARCLPRRSPRCEATFTVQLSNSDSLKPRDSSPVFSQVPSVTL